MNTTFYAEFESYGTRSSSLDMPLSHFIAGPGGNTTSRVSDHILTAKEARDFTIEKVFHEIPGWIDFEYEL